MKCIRIHQFIRKIVVAEVKGKGCKNLVGDVIFMHPHKHLEFIATSQDKVSSKRINHFLGPVETLTNALLLWKGSRSLCLSLNKSQLLISLKSIRICFVEDTD